MSDLEFDLSGSLKVKSNGGVELCIGAAGVSQ